MNRAHWHLHPGVRSGNQLTVGERAADQLKAKFGSWPFLGLLNLIFFVEVTIHFTTGGRFDPGLLLMNLGLSWLAAQQGGALQIAANRGDRINAEVALHTQGNTDALMKVNERQLGILTRLDGIRDDLSELAEAIRVTRASRGPDDH